MWKFSGNHLKIESVAHITWFDCWMMLLKCFFLTNKTSFHLLKIESVGAKRGSIVGDAVEMLLSHE